MDTSTALIASRLAGAAEPDDGALLRSAFAPHPLPPAVLDHLIDAARVVRCPSGPLQHVSPRRPEPSWWLVRRGVMALGKRDAQGQLDVCRTIGPGEWLETAGAMANPGCWFEDADCRGAVELIALPVADMNEACGIDTAFAQAYAGVLAARVRDLHGRLDELASVDVAGRLARWLLRELPDGDPPHTVFLREPKRQLARRLGMSCETFSRVLRRMIDERLIEVHRYELLVLDPPGLQALAATGAPLPRRKRPD